MRRQSRSAYPEASDQELALPRVPPWYRNLNRFPFRQIRLRSVLGPTYPRLRRIAGEPLPLRRRGFSPLYGCYYHRDLQQRTVHWTSRPSFHPNAAPAYRHGCDSVTLGIGAWLSPVYFRRPQPRPVSCYALLGGWLLLSLPSSCLGLRTAFYFYT